MSGLKPCALVTPLFETLNQSFNEMSSSSTELLSYVSRVGGGSLEPGSFRCESCTLNITTHKAFSCQQQLARNHRQRSVLQMSIAFVLVSAFLHIEKSEESLLEISSSSHIKPVFRVPPEAKECLLKQFTSIVWLCS